MTDTRQEEVRKNYDAFVKLLPELLGDKRGKFALMRHGEISEFFDTASDAAKAGSKMFEDGLFSVQEVTDEDVNLGFFSYAHH